MNRTKKGHQKLQKSLFKMKRQKSLKLTIRLQFYIIQFCERNLLKFYDTKKSNSNSSLQFYEKNPHKMRDTKK